MRGEGQRGGMEVSKERGGEKREGGVENKREKGGIVVRKEWEGERSEGKGGGMEAGKDRWGEGSKGNSWVEWRKRREDRILICHKWGGMVAGIDYHSTYSQLYYKITTTS